MNEKYGKMIRNKHLIEVLGGMLALAGLFLPFTQVCSFFQSLGHAAPALVLSIALTTVLYALGLEAIPWV